MRAQVLTTPDDTKNIESKLVWSGSIETLPRTGEYIYIDGISESTHKVASICHRLEEGHVNIFLPPDYDNVFEDLFEGDIEDLDLDDITKRVH